MKIWLNPPSTTRFAPVTKLASEEDAARAKRSANGIVSRPWLHATVTDACARM
ncbi:hypothetical protein SAMN05216489_09945 [Streptomyces sp. 3213]|nr:hypothetical protein SAMN05216489_09945 [Streptomyces sp. 3213] [Streptomyces sp. 3213.3]